MSPGLQAEDFAAWIRGTGAEDNITRKEQVSNPELLLSKYTFQKINLS